MPNETRHEPGTSSTMPQMVGRTVERVLLREHLTAAGAGKGRIALIGGEAGIGKTTLTRDLIASARDSGFTIVTGHNYDLIAAAPYSLWHDLAARYQQIRLPADAAPVPPVLASHTLKGFTSQAELFAQVIAFLHAVSADRPALVVLDDVHWADPASLELLRHVASRLETLRILLVVTYRIDELTRQNPFYRQLPALIRESEGLRLDLNRLDIRDIQHIIELRYAMPDTDRDRLVDYLERYAEGNPFFVMELLRTLEEQPEAGLTQAEDRWLLAQMDHVVMPSLVRQVIDARVAKLGEETRNPLAIAAVIGQEVPLDLWASIAGIDQDAMYAIIGKAVEWQLLNAAPDGTQVHFVHALTREALYEGILPPRRRALHQMVAESLAEWSHPDPNAIAYHFQQAGDPRAPEWLIKAGERAQRAYAWLTARDRFASAADLLQHVPGEEGARARLLYRCGRLQRYSDAPAGIEHLRTAARLAELAGDRVLAADATYSRGLLQCFADEWQLGLANMIRGVEKLEALPPEEARASWTTATWMADALPTIDLASTDTDPASDSLIAVGANHRRGSLPWFLSAVGRVSEAQAIAESFRDTVAGTNPGPVVLANIGHTEFGVGTILATLGRPDDAQDAFNAALERYRQLDHHACIAFVLLAQLTDIAVPYHTTNVAERQRLANDAQQALERASGAFASGMPAQLAQLTVMYLDGRWAEARIIDAESATHGTYNLRRQATHAMAPIARHQGYPLEAWGHVLALLPHGPRSIPGTAVLLDALMLQRLASDLAINAGNMTLARAWLEANDRWLTWSGSELGRADNELAWARWHQASGAVDDAWERVSRAISAAQEQYQPLVLIEAQRLKGELALHRGDVSAAHKALSESLELASQSAVPFQRALTLLAFARLRFATGEEGAADLARDAMALCEPLHARPVLNQLDALLVANSLLEARPNPPAGLTPREIDVLRLVAKGLTDAEIGGHLFISPRTVSQHLHSVYGKLDVRSRTEATRFAIEHGVM